MVLSCLLVLGDTTSYHAYYTDTSKVLCHLIHILSLIHTCIHAHEWYTLILTQISCCDYHSAAISTIGHLYTFGSKENGKLGHGRDVPSGSTGNVTHVSKFLDSDQTTDMGDIRIGYVSCYRDCVYSCLEY